MCKKTELTQLREEINKIDKEISILLQKRLKLAKQIFNVKKTLDEDSNVFVFEREEEIIKKAESLLNVENLSLKYIFYQIISLCRAYEKKINIVIAENDISKFEAAIFARFGPYVNVIASKNMQNLKLELDKPDTYGFIDVKNNKVLDSNNEIEIIGFYKYNSLNGNELIEIFAIIKKSL